MALRGRPGTAEALDWPLLPRLSSRRLSAPLADLGLARP